MKQQKPKATKLEMFWCFPFASGPPTGWAIWTVPGQGRQVGPGEKTTTPQVIPQSFWSNSVPTNVIQPPGKSMKILEKITFLNFLSF